MLSHFRVAIEGIRIPNVHINIFEFGGRCSFTDGKISVLLSGILKCVHLDLQETLLMGQIQEPGIQNEIPSLDGFYEPFIELGLLLFQKLSLFNFSVGNAIQNGKDMFALEQKISFHAFGEIPTGTREFPISIRGDFV
jgi:hypothetical protein